MLDCWHSVFPLLPNPAFLLLISEYNYTEDSTLSQDNTGKDFSFINFKLFFLYFFLILCVCVCILNLYKLHHFFPASSGIDRKGKGGKLLPLKALWKNLLLC